MIISFKSKYKTGWAEYVVLGPKERPRQSDLVELIDGNPNLTKAIYESCRAKKAYELGVISFQGKKSNELMKQIYADFKSLYLDSVWEPGEYNSCAVIHQDTSNSHIHFCLPKTNLRTHTINNYYYDKIDRPRLNAIRDFLILKYNLEPVTSLTPEEREQRKLERFERWEKKYGNVNFNTRKIKDRQKAIKAFNEASEFFLKTNLAKNLDELKNCLNEIEGFNCEIKEFDGKRYISAAINGSKPIKLEGGFYGDDFYEREKSRGLEEGLPAGVGKSHNVYGVGVDEGLLGRAKRKVINLNKRAKARLDKRLKTARKRADDKAEELSNIRVFSNDNNLATDDIIKTKQSEPTPVSTHYEQERGAVLLHSEQPVYGAERPLYNSEKGLNEYVKNGDKSEIGTIFGNGEIEKSKTGARIGGDRYVDTELKDRVSRAVADCRILSDVIQQAKLKLDEYDEYLKIDDIKGFGMELSITNENVKGDIPPNTGWYPNEIKSYKDLIETVRTKCYSNFELIEYGTRKAENVAKINNTLIIDIDNDGTDDLSFNDAVGLLNRHKINGVVFSSKSDRKPKGKQEVVKDRFRILLPFNGEIPVYDVLNRTKSLYKRIMFNVVNKLGIARFVDLKALNDIARCYYPSNTDNFRHKLVKEFEVLDLSQEIEQAKQAVLNELGDVMKSKRVELQDREFNLPFPNASSGGFIGKDGKFRHHKYDFNIINKEVDIFKLINLNEGAYKVVDEWNGGACYTIRTEKDNVYGIDTSYNPNAIYDWKQDCYYNSLRYMDKMGYTSEFDKIVALENAGLFNSKKVKSNHRTSIDELPF